MTTIITNTDNKKNINSYKIFLNIIINNIKIIYETLF